MSRDDRYCASCDALFKWYENTCPRCGAELTDARPDADSQAGVPPLPDDELVTVFETDDPGAAELARLELDRQGIECVVTGPSPWSATTVGPSEILVLQLHADRARELLADLQNDVAPSDSAAEVASPVAGPSQGSGFATIYLHDTERGAFVGRISQAHLDFLCDHLEEDSGAAQTYYVDAATIDMLADQHADAALVDLLRSALGGREGLEFRWSDEP